MPSGSYIAVDDYEKMSDLVDHLKHLMNDTTAYMSYFNWMRDYDMDSDFWRVFLFTCHSKATPTSRTYPLCDLCRKALTDNSTQIRDHIWEWYHDGACEENFADHLLKKQLA